jgi:intracellular sulfur oxidation DsrE/DsrF family protein
MYYATTIPRSIGCSRAARRSAPATLALRGHARRLAKNACMTAEEAAKEFTASIIPGITVIPSGVRGVNRAQKAGCTYCAGG